MRKTLADSLKSCRQTESKLQPSTKQHSENCGKQLTSVLMSKTLHVMAAADHQERLCQKQCRATSICAVTEMPCLAAAADSVLGSCAAVACCTTACQDAFGPGYAIVRASAHTVGPHAADSRAAGPAIACTLPEVAAAAMAAVRHVRWILSPRRRRHEFVDNLLEAACKHGRFGTSPSGRAHAGRQTGRKQSARLRVEHQVTSGHRRF